jgi:6-phospho-3-hexuloisomerase
MLTQEEQSHALIEALSQAERVFVAGAGRSKLAVDAFAMRLMHMGFTAHVAADTTSPAIGAADLLIACSGSGETPTVVSLARAASEAGATVATVTGSPESTLESHADVIVNLCEYSENYEPSSSAQFVGTLFEQGAFVFFDCLVLVICRTQGIDPDAMFDRHANLE